MTFFGLNSVEDLENRAAHTHQEFPGVPPGGFRSERKGYPVYYDQHLAEMHSFSSLQKSHRVNRSLIRYGFWTGAKAIQYRVKMA